MVWPSFLRILISSWEHFRQMLYTVWGTVLWKSITLSDLWMWLSQCTEEALWTKWGIVGILNHWEHNEQSLVHKRWRNGFSKVVNYFVCLHSRVRSPGPTSRKRSIGQVSHSELAIETETFTLTGRERNWYPTSSLLQAMCVIVVIKSSNSNINSKSWKHFKIEIKFYFKKISWSSMIIASSCPFALDVGLEFVHCFFAARWWITQSFHSEPPFYGLFPRLMLKHIKTSHWQKQQEGLALLCWAVQLESFCEELCFMNMWPMQCTLLLLEFLKQERTCPVCLKPQNWSGVWLVMSFHSTIAYQLNCLGYLCTGVFSELFQIM